jgi:chitinase
MRCRRAVAMWMLPVCLGLALVCDAARAQRVEQRRTERPRQVVGYFPQWGVYERRFVPKDLVRSGAITLLTQLDYAQTSIVNNTCAIADAQADTNTVFAAADSIDGVADAPTAMLRGDLHQMQLLHARYPAVRLLISIEGKQSLFEEAAKPENRVAFVRSCVARWLAGHLAPGMEMGRVFTGIDVDWEYPNADHADDFYALMEEFRRQMNAFAPGMLLTIASSANSKSITPIQWSRVAASVDEIGVMTYDFAGPWSHTTGFVAPLRSADPGATTVATVMQAYRAAGVPADKLLLGVPFYAYQWHNVADGGTHGLNAKGDPLRGNHNQSTAEALLAGSTAAKLYRDPVSAAPWIYDGDNFLTFDDAVSLRAKMQYVTEQKLGGVMVWELSGDTDDVKLLHTITESRLSGK